MPSLIGVRALLRSSQMKLRLIYPIITLTGIIIVIAICIIQSKITDSEPFSTRIESARQAYDGFIIETTLTCKDSAPRDMYISNVVFELLSGPDRRYISMSPLNQNPTGKSIISRTFSHMGYPYPSQNDQFRVIYELIEPHESPPEIVDEVHSLFGIFNIKPPKLFTDLYLPPTHYVASQWIPIPKPETRREDEQAAPSNR